MVDLNDERAARRVIEKACPDDKIRKAVLMILAEGIKEANFYGRDEWTVRVAETARLVVGNYYVCTVRETGVWLALDDRFTKAGDYYPTMRELRSWGWVPDEEGKEGSYAHYSDRSRRKHFSINGRYSIGADHVDNWPHIRKLFFDFIYKAIHHGQPMNPNSPGLHSQGALKYMRHHLGTDLPDPLF